MPATQEARQINQDHPYTERMSEFVESFPTLQGVPGSRPWNQYEFARWASGPAPSNAMRLAAAFVLAVWNGGTPRDGGWWNDPEYEDGFAAGVFDPVEAFGLWDHHHQQAYIDWCCDPFWP